MIRSTTFFNDAFFAKVFEMNSVYSIGYVLLGYQDHLKFIAIKD
jgi:hypothetical protein